MDAGKEYQRRGGTIKYATKGGLREIWGENERKNDHIEEESWISGRLSGHFLDCVRLNAGLQFGEQTAWFD